MQYACNNSKMFNKIEDKIALSSSKTRVLSSHWQFVLVGILALMPASGIGTSRIGDSHSMQSSDPVIVEIFTLPSVLDSAAIRSVGHYILLRHLVRPFLEYQNDGQLSGNLMKAWTINKDHTRYTFELADDANWSNGTPVLCEQVASHLQHLKKMRSSIHFDFESLSEVKCLAGNKIEISLRHPNVLFLSQVTEPEFGPVWQSDHFDITSGPYYLKKGVPEKEYVLSRRTANYRGIDPAAPNELVFKSSDVETQIQDFISGKVMFLASKSTLTDAQHKQLISAPGAKALQPRIGFTYWLSLSPHSKTLHDLEVRKKIQSLFVVGGFTPDPPLPTWSPAGQLFLEDGPGRPTKTELEKWKSKLPVKPTFRGLKLSLLLDQTFPFNQQVLARLTGAGIIVNADYYTGQDQYVERMKKLTYDIVLINNDFASVDLLENISVTLNPARPLIFVEKNDQFVAKNLSHARTLLDDVDRYPIYKQIGLHVLERALIVPLMYRSTWFYHSNQLDLSSWSRLFFEVAFWKTRVR